MATAPNIFGFPKNFDSVGGISYGQEEGVTLFLIVTGFQFSVCINSNPVPGPFPVGL